MFPRYLWKKLRKTPKTVDTNVNSIQSLPLPIANGISNTHINPRPQVDYFATNLSTSSRADQDVASYEISYSYERTTSYPTDSVFFKEVNCV